LYEKKAQINHYALKAYRLTYRMKFYFKIIVEPEDRKRGARSKLLRQ